MTDYALEVITPNAALPVTTTELSNHLRLNAPDDSTLLGYYIETATRLFEKMTGRVVSSTGYRQWVPTLPCELARNPVTAISAVNVYNPDDTQVSYTSYHADLFQVPCPVYDTVQLYQHFNQSNPVPSSTKRRYPISVDFTAGYATVPNDIKVAVLLCAAHLWQHRGDDDAGLPPGFLRLCGVYTVRGYMT